MKAKLLNGTIVSNHQKVVKIMGEMPVSQTIVTILLVAPPLNFNSRLLSFYRNASYAAGGFVFLVGFLVLSGWLFDVPTLKSILPGLFTMKANTALAFMLAGTSLWLGSTKRESQWIDLLAKACATVTLLLGLLTLSEYLFSWNPGIDQFLSKDLLTPESAHPGRMSLVNALNFLLLGLSLLLPARHPYWRLVEVFSITALLISVLALLGYVYGVSSLYQFFPDSSIAIHTVLAFLILCVGILFAHPELGLMMVFSSDNLGGLMARRLTPAALVIPFLLGWLFLTGQRMGFYNNIVRLVLSTMSTVIIFASLILWNASLLQRHDFTKRKQAEDEIRKLNEDLNERVIERTMALSQANNLLQVMLDYMPDQIYFKDAQSRFIRNSRSQAKALGLSDPTEAIGKSDFDFFPHAQLSYEKEQEIIKSGKPLVDQEERVVWPDGQETWVLTTKAPLRDQAGQIIGTFGISRDITERKRAEAAVQKAKLELEATNKELEAFSYSVSHDLRAPLRSIDGFSQALLEDYADQLPADGQDHLKRVRATTQRMGQLIDDLLHLSKATRVSMKLVPVDLSRLAQDIVAELQGAQPERRVRSMITSNLKAHGDPGLLQEVLENLLNNAWKFTSKREQAEIEFGSKHENDETVYFIRDNGAGFDMAYAGKLFGAFQRLHAMMEFSGTGIGLAIVQRIINRHGGRIWAEGAVDQGATFFFTLPALERAQPKVVPQEKDSLAKRVKEII